MSSYEFMVEAKKAVFDWLSKRYDAENKTVAIEWTDVFAVWQCKTLQNHKIILAAPTNDEYLFEVTYNGDKKQMYLDVYDKVDNVCIEK